MKTALRIIGAELHATDAGNAGSDCESSVLTDEFPDGNARPPVPWAQVERGPTTLLAGDRPAAAGCPDDLLAPSPAGNTYLLTGARPGELTESPAWTVVTTDTDVSTTPVGCDPWAVLFCTPPRSHPLVAPQ